MARRPEVEYIRYYTDGSAARQVEPKVPRKKHPLPKVKKQPKHILYIQPMAIVGIVLSAVMLIMMIVGSVELYHVQRQKQAMEAYVTKLTQENAAKRAAYEEGVDLEAIEKSALAIGMVPQEQVKQMIISVPVAEIEEESGFWENIILFLEGLFA